MADDQRDPDALFWTPQTRDPLVWSGLALVGVLAIGSDYWLGFEQTPLDVGPIAVLFLASVLAVVVGTLAFLILPAVLRRAIRRKGRGSDQAPAGTRPPAARARTGYWLLPVGLSVIVVVATLAGASSSTLADISAVYPAAHLPTGQAPG